MIFTPQSIKARIKNIPFRPVRFITSAGKQHDLYHPDLIIVGKTYVTLGIPSPEDPAIGDGDTRIAIAHITEMQDLATPIGSVAVADAA